MPSFPTPLDLLAAADRLRPLEIPDLRKNADGVVASQLEAKRRRFQPLTQPDLVPMQPLSQPTSGGIGRLQALLDPTLRKAGTSFKGVIQKTLEDEGIEVDPKAIDDD